MKILAIETSCDETAAAVVEDGVKIISNVVATSADMHEKWGGIVPEIAARKQLEYIVPILLDALSPFSKSRGKSLALSSKLSFGLDQNAYKPLIEKNIDAIAVTIGPGLIGSLLIGVEVAKTIAWITGKPLIPVNHVLAHMYANFIAFSDEVNSKIPTSSSKKGLRGTGKTQIKQSENETITYPAISLVVSGGHTELYLMKSPKNLKWLGGTIDDAAGEAFDKTARLLGFGSGGGLAIQEAAKNFKRGENSEFTVKLPRPIIDDDTLNFSFSGLKTAVLREVNKLKANQQFNNVTIQQCAYEVQEAITDVLVEKTLKASGIYKAKSILLSGGVSSNLRLREKFQLSINNYQLTIDLFCPLVNLCTDNAVYIASYAFFRGQPEDFSKVEAIPDLSVEV